MHEIVTLQIGSQANYLGTHFWNAQESYFTYSGQEESPIDHDVNFRSGIGADGSDTYMPRTVIYDFKGNFGTLKQRNELYEVFGDQSERRDAWRGATVTHRQPPVPTNDYQQHLNQGLEPPLLNVDNVRFWSDYNRVFYHPRSIVQIYETELDPGHRSFDQWKQGEELFISIDKEQDLFDRDVRPFVEECDQMQGFQIMSSVGDGWGGFSARYMDRLRDEFEKISIWVWALGNNEQNTNTKVAMTQVNEAQSLYEISPQSSLYIPITNIASKLPSYISINRHAAWHTSAVQCTAFETVLLPSRLRYYQDITSLDDLANSLNIQGNQKIAQLEFSIAEVNSRECCDLFPRKYDTPAARGVHDIAKIEASRGEIFEKEDTVMENREDLVNPTKMRSFHTRLPFPLLDSFPHIYASSSPRPHSNSVRACLSTSTSAASWIKSLEQVVRLRVDVEERETLSNGLKEISEAYETDAPSDEDTWDD